MTETLTETAREAAALAARRAAENDEDPTRVPLEHTLRELGALQALDTPDIAAHVRLLDAVAGQCLSTAFSIWAQRMVVAYLDASANTALAGVRADVAEGRRAGSIAMATAMQELAGIGAVPTRAESDGDGYIVSGRIAWASNIVPGTLVVFPARTDDGHVLLAAHIGQDGLHTTPVRGLLALEATRSSMLRFDGVRIGADRVLAHTLAAASDQRTLHYLTQAAFCLGLARRCLDEASTALHGPGALFGDAHRRLAAELDAQEDQIHTALILGQDASPAAVTQVRLDAGTLAQQAARLESTLVGGRGFVRTSPANRRLREAAFLPVQSPSEVQLRWELQALSRV